MPDEKNEYEPYRPSDNDYTPPTPNPDQNNGNVGGGYYDRYANQPNNGGYQQPTNGYDYNNGNGGYNGNGYDYNNGNGGYNGNGYDYNGNSGYSYNGYTPYNTPRSADNGDGMATASLVCGVLSILGCGGLITAILAVVLAFISRNRSESKKFEGKAMGGLVMGGICLGLYAAVVLLYIVLFVVGGIAGAL